MLELIKHAPCDGAREPPQVVALVYARMRHGRRSRSNTRVPEHLHNRRGRSGSRVSTGKQEARFVEAEMLTGEHGKGDRIKAAMATVINWIAEEHTHDRAKRELVPGRGRYVGEA